MERKNIDLSINDLDLNPKNSFSFSLELEDLQFKRKEISLELTEIQPLSISVNLKDLKEIEKQIKAARKKFGWDEDAHINAFHGTRSREWANSIVKDGWKVGAGNAVGSGIYFGFIPSDDKNNKLEIPVSGQSFRSNTAADGYMGGSSGALLLLHINWEKLSIYELDKGGAKQETKSKNDGKSYYGGDAITEWGINNGYDCLRSLNGRYGVKLEHQYQYTKTFWKTDKIKIKAIYFADKHEVINFE